MTETNISHIIGQRVIARSPQTGRRYCGEVIGIASLPRLNEPVVIIRLDHGGSLMRVFPYCIKLDEEGSEWLR